MTLVVGGDGGGGVRGESAAHAARRARGQAGPSVNIHAVDHAATASTHCGGLCGHYRYTVSTTLATSWDVNTFDPIDDCRHMWWNTRKAQGNDARHVMGSV
jgi:hypothetical protein